MKTRSSFFLQTLAVAFGFGLLAVCDGSAQQSSRYGGSPSGGYSGRSSSYGSGGTGGSAGSTTAGNLQYNANGAVGNATISIDTDTHNVTILADDETTKYISSVITNLDRPQAQVLIKVVFVQVTHSDELDVGLDAAATPDLGSKVNGYFTHSFGLSSLSSAVASNTVNALGQPVSSFQQISPYTGGSGAGLYQILGKDYQATLRAIAASGKAEVLSRPSILARNNQPASVVIGQYVPLITSVSYTDSGQPINSISYTAVGIILTVTPYITSDGMVQMIVAPQSSSVDSTSSVTLSQGITAPYIDTVSANTVAITPNGQTVVIGGLMHRTKASSVSKIPWLGDIPWLGNLFKRTTTSAVREELLIFLTPYIITSNEQIASLSNYEHDHSLVPKSYTEQDLNRLLDRLPTNYLQNAISLPPAAH